MSGNISAKLMRIYEHKNFRARKAAGLFYTLRFAAVLYSLSVLIKLIFFAAYFIIERIYETRIKIDPRIFIITYSPMFVEIIIAATLILFAAFFYSKHRSLKKEAEYICGLSKIYDEIYNDQLRGEDVRDKLYADHYSCKNYYPLNDIFFSSVSISGKEYLEIINLEIEKHRGIFVNNEYYL